MMARSSRSVSSTFLNAKKCLHLRHKGNQDKIPLLGTNNQPISVCNTICNAHFPYRNSIYYSIPDYILIIEESCHKSSSYEYSEGLFLLMRWYKNHMTLQMSISTISFYLVDLASLLFLGVRYCLPSSFIKTSSSRTEYCINYSNISTPQSYRSKFSGSCV